MSTLQRTDSFELDNKTFTIKALNFEDSRKGYAIVSKALGALADEDTAKLDVGVIMSAISGTLSADDLKALTDLFAPHTMVDFNDANTEKNQSSRLLRLSKPEVKDEVFGGALEVMFDWLEKCVRLSYGSVIAKMIGAIEAVSARKAPKAKLTDEETSNSQT